MNRKILAFILSTGCLLSFSEEFSLTETEDQITVSHAGKSYSILKKPEPNWKKYAIFRIGDVRENNTLGVHAHLQSIPNALLPNGNGARFTIVENGSDYKTVHAEYPFACLNKNLKNAKLAVDFYFMKGIPGVAIDTAIAAQGKKIVTTWLSASFSSHFTAYAKPDGKWITLPKKGWIGTGGKTIFCEKNGERFLISPSTEFSSSRGIAIVSERARGKCREVTLNPGEKLTLKCVIGFLKKSGSELDEMERLLAFRENVSLISEKKNTASEITQTGPEEMELKSYPVRKAIRIGTFSDWEGVPLLAERNKVSDLRPQAAGSLWQGPESLSFKAWSAFDKDNLYLRVQVRDKDFVQMGTGSQIWNGDCIQIAFDPFCEKMLSGNYIEIGVAAAGKTIVCGWRHPNGEYVGDDLSQVIPCAARRDSNGYECEMAIPWKFLAPFELSRGKIGFNIVVLNNGNTWMGITDGIAGGKNPEFYKDLYFTSRETVLKTALEKGRPKLHFQSGTLLSEKPVRFSASVIAGKEFLPAELVVEFPNGPVLKKALKDYFNTVPFQLEPGTLQPGVHEVKTYLLQSGKKTGETRVSITVLNRDFLKGFLKQAEDKLNTLSGKITEIRNRKGMEPSYLAGTAAVMRHFVTRFRTDVNRDFSHSVPGKKILQWTPEYIYPRAYSNLRYMIPALEDAISRADRMLAGKEAVRTVPEVPRGIRPVIRDGGFQINGKEVLFFGPNTWVCNDIERKLGAVDKWSMSEYELNLIRDSGFNFINVFNQWRHPTGNPMGSVAKNRARRDRFILELEKNGIFFNSRNTWAGKIPRTPEGRQKHMAEWEKTFQKNLSSTELEFSSPAHVFTIGSEEFPHLYFHKTLDFGAFRKHLEKRYRTIGKLNETLGTKYSGFDKIQKSDILKPGMKYAYYEYASDLFLEAEREYMQVLRKNIGLPISSHYSYCNFFADDPLNTFFDPDRLFENYDVPGLDIGCGMKHKTYAFDWSVFMIICDLIRSFHPDRPLADNEGYTLLNYPGVDIPTLYHYTAMFQPFFHGMNSCSLFHFDLYDEDSFSNGPFTRADAFHVSAKLAMDLRRLPEEVAAFRKASAPFAILYSMPSFADPMHKTHLLEIYEGCYFSGFPCRFVGDRQVLSGKLEDCKILVVPNAQYVPEKVFSKIAQFSRDGGTVLLFGEDSLSRDEYGKKVPSRDPIRKTFRVISTDIPKRYSEAFNGVLDEKKLKPEVEVVGKDGKKVFGLEYRSVKDKKGNLLLYLINLNKSPVHVEIKGGGNWLDLIENRKNPCGMTLNPLEIRFLRRTSSTSPQKNP